VHASDLLFLVGWPLQSKLPSPNRRGKRPLVALLDATQDALRQMRDSRTRTLTHLPDERNCYQAKDARYRVDDEIAQPRVPAGYKHLGNFDSAGKGYESGREQRRQAVAQRECNTGSPIDCEMLKVMWQACFRPQSRGYY
jgi:hypothetical protein